MQKESKFITFEYNGQKLSLNAIAKLEGLTNVTLRKKYEQTQDIHEAVKLAKEGQTAMKPIEYKGKMYGFYGIANLEGINRPTLKRFYEQTGDIYEAVRLTKESQSKVKEKEIIVEYYGESLHLTTIATRENLTRESLKKNYEQTGDIYEAVRITRESQENITNRNANKEYHGEMLPLYKIAEREGVPGLGKYYAQTHDIYEAVKLAKENQKAYNETTVYVDYNGENMSLSRIAKIEGLTASALKNYYKKTNDIYKAIELARKSQEKRKEQITIVEYKGQQLSIHAIALIENLTENHLRRNYSKLLDIYAAIELTQKEKEEHSGNIEYNGEKLSLAKIAEKEQLNYERFRKNYLKVHDVYVAIEMTRQSERNIELISYGDKELSLYKIAEIEGLSQKSLKMYYQRTNDIYEAVKQAKEASERKKIFQADLVLYNGEYLTLNAIAQKENISDTTLRRKYHQTNDVYEAIKHTREAKEKNKNRLKTPILYNGEYLALTAIAKKENINAGTLSKQYYEINDIYEAVRLSKEIQQKEIERKQFITYNGEKLSIGKIAERENVVAKTLREKYAKCQDIYKAVMMCKTLKAQREKKQELVDTKQLGKLSYYDISMILGIKYTTLINLLKEGKSIDAIIELKFNKNVDTRSSSSPEKIKLENGQSLAEYCIENKLNYSCIYRAMKIYGRTLEEAVANYNKNGQETPTHWIYEKYGLLFKHLMLKESIDIKQLVLYMRQDYLPMEQAIEKYIVRTNAKKADLDKDWMEELYEVLSDNELSQEDYNGYVKTFYVNKKEEECVKQSKTRFNEIKRKLLLFDIAESLEEELFEPEEEKELLKVYDISEDEVDIIFKELYKRFITPGVLLGKDQESQIDPEQIKQRDYNIRKYKEMVQENKQDQDIILMMRFMVGPNVESNEECRTELHKELQKENKQVDVGQ